MTRNELTTAIAAAKKTLLASGWTHSHSVMADKAGQAGNCFGLVFIKAGHRFYLNLNTLDMVSDACQPIPAMTNAD